MKLSLIVVAAVLSIAVCDVTPAFRKPKGIGCECHQKTCTDMGCDESNCLCMVDSLQHIESQKDSKYNKQWIASYRHLVEDRCLCIEGCLGICDPSETSKCIRPAFDQFICEWHKLLAGIHKQRGYQEFVNDIARINAICINNDCEPPLSGGPCDFLNDDASTECILDKVDKIVRHLQNDRAVEIIQNYALDLAMYFSKVTRCKKHFDEVQCKFDARDELESETGPFFYRLEDVVGSCSAIALHSVLKEAVIDCSVRDIYSRHPKHH